MFAPLGGARLTILLLGPRPSSPQSSNLALVVRDRSRSLIGDGAYVRGGVGSCASDGEGAIAAISVCAFIEIRDCRERHVFMIFPMVLCDDMIGGLAGGETKRPVREREEGCEASQVKADGRSIVESKDENVWKRWRMR